MKLFLFSTSRISVLVMIIGLVSSQIKTSQTNTGKISGRVYNAGTNEAVPFATVQIWGTSTGTITDEDGRFTITGIKPGFVELRVSSVGFKPYISGAMMVTPSNHMNLEIPLEELEISIGEVVIRASPFARKAETPVSARVIGLDEIERNPGGNRDISRVLQSFPGVASTPAFRNDVIVRGGGPNENRFYIDNVEIPYLNHFSTQGASGGPQGIVNVDFVQSVDFLSGAFPASRGNALSSVLSFNLIDGDGEKMKYRATVGASDLGLTINGPAGEKGTLIMSVRRSYLQFLFSVLELPFLPAYTDFQVKYKVRLDDKNELTILGIGAKDDFELNLKADDTDFQRYILDFIPVQEQYSYVAGIVYKHYRSNGYDTWVLSRNYLNNRQYKDKDNIESAGRLLDYKSGEGEIKGRYERTIIGDNGLRFSYGAGLEYAHYRNSTFRRQFDQGSERVIDYESNLKMAKYGLFGQASKTFAGKTTLSFGIRADGNSYSELMANPLSQVSPRISASFSLTDRLSLNASTGRYFQLPPYTALGYSENGEYINRNNRLRYVSSDHFVAGLELIPDEKMQFTLEGFFKKYNRYPFSVREGVPLSSKSVDYGIFGDEELVSTAEGRAYGVELLARLKEFRKTNLVMSYTFVRSEFRGAASGWLPSAWDNKHLLNLTATKRFNRNWDLGFKWRFVGGAPYTPYDEATSPDKLTWQGRARLDYSRFNTLRLKAFHQLDIRIDKQFFFSKWSLMLYGDVQNAYNHKADQPPLLVRVTDENKVPLDDPADPSKYLLKYIESEAATLLPTVGIIIEF